MTSPTPGTPDGSALELPSMKPVAHADAVNAVRVEAGTCLALFAYDVGLSVDLDEAQRRITAAKQRGSIRHKRRAPYYFEYQPAPLRVTSEIPPIKVAGFETSPIVEAVVFDFGGISVAYSIPLAGPLEDLRGLSDALWDPPDLLRNSREIVESLLRSIGPAVHRPRVSSVVEDYTIYQIRSLADEAPIDDVVSRHAPLIAQILRAESTPLSAQEIGDALSCQIAYSAEDRTIIDWNATLLFDADANDVLSVLEFANIELLELRYLDDQLDVALDQAYETFSRRRRADRLRLSRNMDVGRIAALQMDSALLYEGVTNALKLLGDQYLARVYRLCSQRLHLDDWNASIQRKLQTIESVYEKLSDREAARRMEVLEWIIIGLITISVVLQLLPIGGGH